MKAGQIGVYKTSSVRPLSSDDSSKKEGEDVPELLDPDTDDEGGLVEFGTEVADRIGLEKEDKFMMKLIDPKLPTKEEVERHQATHTPYAPWCKHCVTARAVRRRHPHRGRGAVIVPDVDSDTTGPIKVSLDYMHLHERNGRGPGGVLLGLGALSRGS